ncbi:hypothetical protein BC834DRAFT_897672 [Gloeopeniophorella convolvens]|nr:hypothetical protein BC834DRAFT_897672 [Gloeopeniophorella convolvens]
MHVPELHSYHKATMLVFVGSQETGLRHRLRSGSGIYRCHARSSSYYAMQLKAVIIWPVIRNIERYVGSRRSISMLRRATSVDGADGGRGNHCRARRCCCQSRRLVNILCRGRKTSRRQWIKCWIGSQRFAYLDRGYHCRNQGGVWRCGCRGFEHNVWRCLRRGRVLRLSYVLHITAGGWRHGVMDRRVMDRRVMMRLCA